MTGRVDLDDLLTGFDQASHESTIREGVSHFLSHQNINAYIYHNLPAIGSADFEKSYSYQDKLGMAEEQSTIAENFEIERFLREHVRSLIGPKFWNDWKLLKTSLQSGSNDVKSPRPMNSLQGVSIPVHGPCGRDGCFSLEFMDSVSSSQDLDIHVVHWVCQNAHLNFCRLLRTQMHDFPQLTAREKQILTWIALGKSNADIADILGISFHTVGTYTRRIFVKTNTNNRTSAALFGISNGLINV